jgi:hypothetical protein
MEKDTDPNGLDLQLIQCQVTNPNAGIVDFTIAGGVEFRPNVNFSGTAILAYTIYNGSETDSGEISVVVPVRTGWNPRF